MESINKIIVPVDLLENTDKLVAYACHMASRLGASLEFIHVVAPYPGDVMVGSPFAQEYREKMYFAAQEKIANLVHDNREKCPGCTGQTIKGDPVEKIVEHAETAGADLLIISTHGSRGLEKILLGSVTERVLKRVHCPVLIMNPFKKRRS